MREQISTKHTTTKCRTKNIHQTTVPPTYLVTSFFFFFSFTYYLLFVCWSCKRIKDRKGKRQGYLKTQILFPGFTTISWCGTFSCTSRNNRVSWSRCLRNNMESFLVNCEFKGPSCVCVQLVMFSWGCC